MEGVPSHCCCLLCDGVRPLLRRTDVKLWGRAAAAYKAIGENRGGSWDTGPTRASRVREGSWSSTEEKRVQAQSRRCQEYNRNWTRRDTVHVGEAWGLVPFEGPRPLQVLCSLIGTWLGFAT